MQIKTFTGLPFKHNGRDIDGVDCIGLVILYLKNYSIYLPEGDGKWIAEDWYHRQPDRLTKGLQNTGFIKVAGNPDKLDVVLFKFYDTVRHCGVMVSRTKFLHIHKGRTSTVERLNRWNSRLDSVYRYVGGEYN